MRLKHALPCASVMGMPITGKLPQTPPPGKTPPAGLKESVNTTTRSSSEEGNSEHTCPLLLDRPFSVSMKPGTWVTQGQSHGRPWPVIRVKLSRTLLQAFCDACG